MSIVSETIHQNATWDGTSPILSVLTPFYRDDFCLHDS